MVSKKCAENESSIAAACADTQSGPHSSGPLLFLRHVEEPFLACSLSLEQQSRPRKAEEDMTSNSKKPLRPEDFPVDVEGQKIKKQNGTPLADAESPAVAAEIVEPQ